MSILRRVLPAVPAVLAVALAIGGCGSDSTSSASSTPTTAPDTTNTQLAVTTTATPGTIAIGAPIPIGGETTTVRGTDPATADSSSPDTTGASATSSPGTDGGATTATTAPSGGGSGTSTPTTAATSTTTTLVRPNANTDFCRFETKVEKAGDDAADDDAFLAALKDLYPEMQQWVMSAPDDDRRQAAITLRDATKASIDAGDLDSFDSDGATEALLTVQLYCGATDPA